MLGVWVISTYRVGSLHVLFACLNCFGGVYFGEMLAFATIFEYTNVEVILMTKSTRWNDPESLVALEESKQIEANPGAYKHFKNAANLIADCLDGDDDE